MEMILCSGRLLLLLLLLHVQSSIRTVLYVCKVRPQKKETATVRRLRAVIKWSSSIQIE